jgi:hypothetical protein
MNSWLIILVSFILIFSHSSSYAFRCNNGKYVVSIGAQKSEIQAQCGTPDKQEKVEVSARGTYIDGVYIARAQYRDKWYYNCGDNDFIYVFTFENDILIEEGNEGRGNGPSKCKW